MSDALMWYFIMLGKIMFIFCFLLNLNPFEIKEANVDGED